MPYKQTKPIKILYTFIILKLLSTITKNISQIGFVPPHYDKHLVVFNSVLVQNENYVKITD